jgi:hypothetical protein
MAYNPQTLIEPQTTAYTTKSFVAINSNTVGMVGADLGGSETINVQIWASAGYTPLIQLATRSAFPATGVSNTIYQAIDTGIVYYWNGTTYFSDLTSTVWAGGQIQLLPTPHYAGKWINYLINSVQQGMNAYNPVCELSFNDSIIYRLVKSVTVNKVGVAVNPNVQIGVLANGE